MIELVGASDNSARIVVIGVGGGGGNAINSERHRTTSPSRGVQCELVLSAQ